MDTYTTESPDNTVQETTVEYTGDGAETLENLNRVLAEIQEISHTVVGLGEWFGPRLRILH